MLESTYCDNYLNLQRKNVMKLQNVHGYSTIDAYVKYKLAAYEGKEKNFESLFELMFDERDNVMVETTDGYRVNKVSYGEFRQKILIWR